jgi:hypothetical protein
MFVKKKMRVRNRNEGEMSFDAAVLGFIGGIAGNVFLSCVVDELKLFKRNRSLQPFEQTGVKIASLMNTLMFSAADFQGGVMGSLSWESFTSSVSSWREGAKYPQVVFLGSTGMGVLVGFSVDQIVKETFASLLGSEPVLVNIGAGILAWKATSVTARKLSEKIWWMLQEKQLKEKEGIQ